MNINELQKKAAAGDRIAEEQLFEQLSARFRFFAKQNIWNMEDGEEAVQEALAIVFDRYKDIEFETSFVAWAHKVLQNIIYNHNSKRALRRNIVAGQEGFTGDETGRELNPIFEAKLLECFRKVARRSSQFARAINLSYQGYGTEEICSRLTLTRSNFYSVLSRARSLLAYCLEKGEI